MEAERRQVSILFADMVGFTTFSEKSGEEAAFTLMRSLSKLMERAVTEQGGFVRGFTGDGIMAVFGAPVAFEDAPLRACRAALSILERIKVDGPDLEIKHGVRPHLRIGLNTGTAVVGKVQEGVDAAVTVLGDAVNFAARLQALAEPDAVVMSEATHRLVQGMIEASFAGEHLIKGKSQPQRVYRLDNIHSGATRFEIAVSRGLSSFVGRERELAVLASGLEEARSQLRVIDVVAEPGMGKSRLLHEFRQRVGKERAFVLSGNCSPDGQLTPFLPFIEVVRGSFRVSAGEAEKSVTQKLEMGLTTLGLHSVRNLGLLLHLLGLRTPEGALTGLDGVLIGLRTRELLQQLLEARCRLSPVIMLIEDLHWVDSVSEELLGKIVNSQDKLRLLLLHTRRPEYAPAWVDHAGVIKLPLEPLPGGDIRRLIQARLGVDILPEALARQVMEKAEGNPLFAEEIVSYLRERGILKTTVDFDATALATALPASVESLLTARVDRLATEDRTLLQAASVIGRRFDAELLAFATGQPKDIDVRLAALRASDLIHFDTKSDEYVFKHALVRDALYGTLLSDARTALHAKIADEIERRSGNRIVEVAEVLAHHFCRTNFTDKAFAYLSMAGSKCLGVYSLDEATTHFTDALALLDRNPDCASDDQVAEFLAPYTLLLNTCLKVKTTIDILQRYLGRIDRLGLDQRVVVIRHNYVVALIWNTRYQEALAVQRETSPMATRLGDSRSKAYSLAGEIHASTMIAPKTLEEFQILKDEAIKAASETIDAYIHNWTRFVIGWEEFHRGRMIEARDIAHELMRVGQQLNDPRSTGFGLALLAWIALLADSYAEALEYCEEALAVAVTPFERSGAINGKGGALVLLRRTEEGLKLLEEVRRRCADDGDLYTLGGNEGTVALGKVLQGDISGGIRMLEEAISRQDKIGYRVAAGWYRFFLCEVYLQIIAGKEKPPLATLLRNLPVLVKVIVTAPSRIPALMNEVKTITQYDPKGYHVGHAELMLGLFYKARKKREHAVQHLNEAKRLLSQFGETPMLGRANTALAELAQ